VSSPGTRWRLGAVETIEEVKNTYITDANSDTFPIRRNDTAFYFENRFQLPGGWMINAGVRGEFLNTGAIPTDGYSVRHFRRSLSTRSIPKWPRRTAGAPRRLHASFGTGFRPPTGFDLAYTDNPSLKPERTRGFDAGVERRFFHDVLSLDATFFYNRYYDLIVILGGNLAVLSHYESDNIANSRGLGTEYSARLRPARWFYVTGWYTWLDSEILSLNGTANLAPAPFTVGQQLLRRPANSGAFAATFTRGRVSGGLDGYFRGLGSRCRSQLRRLRRPVSKPRLRQPGRQSQPCARPRSHRLRQPAQRARPTLRRGVRLPLAPPELRDRFEMVARRSKMRV
jgi:outer membrane receptor protein involved in Fe transport